MAADEPPARPARVLHVLRSMFRDNVKARQLGADGRYVRRTPGLGEPPYRVQQVLQDEARRAAQLARETAGITLVPVQDESRA